MQWVKKLEPYSIFKLSSFALLAPGDNLVQYIDWLTAFIETNYSNIVNNIDFTIVPFDVIKKWNEIKNKW